MCMEYGVYNVQSSLVSKPFVIDKHPRPGEEYKKKRGFPVTLYGDVRARLSNTGDKTWGPHGAISRAGGSATEAGSQGSTKAVKPNKNAKHLLK